MVAPPVFTDLGTVRATRDLDVASAVLSDTYADLTIRLPATAGPFGMRLEHVELPDVQIAVLDLSSAWLRTVPYPTYTVCLPVRGRVRATVGGSAVTIGDGQGISVCPASGEVEVEYLSDDCRVLTVTLGRRALERELEAMLGHPIGAPIRFDLALDTGRGASLQRSLALVGAELADPAGMGNHGAARHQLGRLLMNGLLMGQRHSWSDELHRPAGFEGPRAIRLAVDAIAEQPMAFPTVADVARAAHLSVRALEAGFRRHVGLSPMTHVRQVRLDRAHGDLARAEPGTITVTAVAQRWGFAHYGRFTAEYRRRYGCSPRQTLARGPGRPAGGA
ncbi:MAG: AraC family transcriptional regulator [Acidimicrobiales bacterium]